MANKIDLNRTVYDLVQEYPELVDLMKRLGFSEITKQAMLRSLGKVMTIPKGAKARGIPMEKVLKALEENGYEVTGIDRPISAPPSAETMNRKAMLKGFLKRLSAGEALESVRADFVSVFRDVDASEIMQAEQELIREGLPLSEVQRLCDVHSALFHDSIREEQPVHTEKAAKAASPSRPDYADKQQKAAALAAIPGHPLHLLTRENAALTERIEAVRNALEQKQELSAPLAALRDLSDHYARKGDLLYPLLKVRYGISGPSDVMWTVDDEIRDELSALTRSENRDADWMDRLQNVLTRIEEMIYKENNILFPICAVNFTEEEWKGIYRDGRDYASCFGVESITWAAAEEAQAPGAPMMAGGEIALPGGHLTVEQLAALLNTLPLEITFVDAEDINRYFNEGPKVFKRPGMALDRKVFSCHPPKVEAMVRAILDDFRNGRRDVVPVWMEKGGRTLLVRYMAVRDRNGRYLGTVEAVEDMEDARAHFSEKQ